MRPVLPVACLAALAAMPAIACGATLSGSVYVDRNGDRVRQGNEPGVPGAVVALDGISFVVTDARGDYTLDVPVAAGIVWVRVPDGFRPGPVWRPATAADLDLGLVPLTDDEAASPLTFVVASDTHMTNNPADPWDGGDLADAIDQAIGLPQPPRFFTIVGDVTQGNQPGEFDRVDAALAGVTVPWVPVPGNHDWYDGGATWRTRWGPDQYSFDIGDLHFVVWDTNRPAAQQLAFFTADLERVPASMTVVGLGHGSPVDEVADELAALGVDYLFTGHWHANRRVERAGLVEWGTQTFVMGSIDQAPSGYRVVTFEGGQPSIVHRERLLQPQLAVTAPHPGSCAPTAGFELIVAAALDASTPEVTARIDCGEPVALASRGGWTFAATVPPLASGTHSITLRAESPSGRSLERQVAIEVCAPAGAEPPAAGDWPQLGGDAAHAGAAARPLAPPLTQRWATSVGGSVVLGSPVVKDGVVVVAVTDLGSGDRGGLVALDLASGAERWRYATDYQVRNAPAIDGDTVVVALGNGEVHAVGLTDGARRWIHDVADGLPSFEASLWAAPTIADGTVLIAVQGRMAALELATGEPLWEKDLTPVYPWLGSLAAVAVGDGAAIATYSRDDGLTAWSAATGAKLWELRSGKAVAINATPVIDAGVVYIINAVGTITAIELATAQHLWSNDFTPGGFDWGYSITAAPALAGGTLFVPTQWKDLVAVDAATGAERWRYTTPGGPLNFAHYRSAEPGFPASPVVTGDIVWAPRPDGTLVALAAADGRELWTTELGAPIVSAPAPAGDYLIVATYDGTVRALAPAPAAAAPGAIEPCAAIEPPGDGDDDGGGCCSSARDDGRSTLLLGAVVLAGLMRRRRGLPARHRGPR
ncbi:MAG TPA: PQQ-binding-like beta-propeller repeat protein [Kofleriaceae bacterium]|nr:PQQ-binding-like beta-propeller repeat protein [Kofleriaceae bacterium]